MEVVTAPQAWGSFGRGDGLHLSVYAFSNKDVDKLMFTLQDKFNLRCSIHYIRQLAVRDKNPVYIFSKNLWIV